MKALVLKQHGGLENLEVVTDHPRPQADEGHVVIRVRASSFNYHDVFTVKGMPGIKVPLPVVIGLGVDPVHFGVILILNLGIGLCTPPVGAVLFVGCAVGRISIWQAMRTIWPFYGAAFLTLMLVTYIPALSLWLPSLFH